MKLSGAVPLKMQVTLSWWMLAALIVLLGVGVGYITAGHNPAGTMPGDIRSSLTFSPLVVPSSSRDFTAGEYAFTSGEDGVQILTYRISTPYDISVTVSEYVQPDQFVEIPEYKERFLTNVAKQYATVQTANGTIYLGRLEKAQGRQVGVLLERGLIVFLNPTQDLSEEQWRSLGDAFELQKIR